jgi:hypothetical protein
MPGKKRPAAEGLRGVLDRYNAALQLIPAPGAGCHPALLGVANLKTIQKALRDHQGGAFIPRPRLKPVVRDGRNALHKIISQAKISDEVDLWELSPIRLLDDPAADTALLLETLFKPNEMLFIGDRYNPGIINKTIRKVKDWIRYFQTGGKTAPFIIINPLTGRAAPAKGGDKETLRGDLCVKNFKFCLIEFDNLSHKDQMKFWAAVKLPIVVLIDSAGKSIHGWIDVQRLAKVETPEQWQSQIKGRLYDRILRPLGVDTTCSNPARLSRLPGHWRGEKAMQRILWLSPMGRSIC